MAVSFSLTSEEQTLLGSVALSAIEARLRGSMPPPPDEARAPQSVLRPLGCFVTLNIGGHLRGCIGSIIGREPLIRNVWRMAQSAAFQDPRFRPLAPAEWPTVTMEITVLDTLSRCPDPSQIVIGRHGLVLALRGRTGVFLPQVPVEQHWDLSAYLTNLCYKAGLPDGAWRHPEAQLLWYEGFVFPVSRNRQPS